MQGRIGTVRGQVTVPFYYSDTQVAQQLSLPPPILQHYIARLRDCQLDHSQTPHVFEAILNDEEFFRDVNGFYNKGFGELLKEVAWKWWRACAKDILHQCESTGDDNFDDDCVTAGEAAPGVLSGEDGKEADTRWGRRQRDRMTLLASDSYRNLRSVLLLVGVMCAPYRVVRDEGCPTVTCTARLLLCRDPSIVYLGLLINFTQPYLPDKVLDSIAVLRIVAQGWEAFPTFEDVVKCYLRKRQRWRRRRAGVSGDSDDKEKEQEAADVALLRLPNLVRNSLHIAPERMFRHASDDSKYPIDPVKISRVVLQGMTDASGDPEQLLWWCRCRLLCLQLLPPPERDEVLSGPSCDFFRSVWRTERLFPEILDEVEVEEVEGDDSSGGKNNGGDGREMGGSTGLSEATSAAALVGTIADVVRAWHSAERGGGMFGSLIMNYTTLNPLDTLSRVVPSHRKFQLTTHRCLADDWQYRLLTDYHSTHIAVFPPSNSSYSTMLPAMVAQLTEMLRRHPHYCPVFLLRSLALARENTNTSIALNYGLVHAVVTVMRTHMDEHRASDDTDDGGDSSSSERAYRYGWTYNGVTVLRWCFAVLERLTMVSTHESVNPIVFLLSPHGDDGYELCRHICEKILHPGGHPVLLSAAFRFFAACIHHNVRDVVPALLQRGVLQAVLDIVEGATLLKRYNERAIDDQVSSPATIPADVPHTQAAETEAQLTSSSMDSIRSSHRMNAPRINEVDVAHLDNKVADASETLDPLAYYEQAIPIVNLCGILQAFAVHNTTHTQLNKPWLMHHFLWSLVVPTVAPPSPPPPTVMMTMATRSSSYLAAEINYPRVTTRAAGLAGRDLFSLVRTMPELQDSFFVALTNTLLSLMVKAHKRNPPKEVALSIWNVLACLGGAEFRQLLQRNSHRRQRHRQPDTANSLSEKINEKFIQCKSVLEQTVATLFRLPCRNNFTSSVCNVFSTFLCDLPLAVFEGVSRVVIEYARTSSNLALSGFVTEDCAAKLHMLTCAFFTKFQSTPSSSSISKFRRDLANTLFDMYVSIEGLRADNEVGKAADCNEEESHLQAASATDRVHSPASLPPATTMTGQRVVDMSTMDMEFSFEWSMPSGVGHHDDATFPQHDERAPQVTTVSAVAGAADGNGVGRSEATSEVERFRQCVARILLPPADRYRPLLPSLRVHHHQHCLLSPNQHAMLPVNTTHVLRGAEKTLQDIASDVKRAAHYKRIKIVKKKEEINGTLSMQEVIRVAALEALGLSQLRGVERRMRSAEALLSVVWRSGASTDGGFTSFFASITACLQSITETLLPLRDDLSSAWPPSPLLPAQRQQPEQGQIPIASASSTTVCEDENEDDWSSIAYATGVKKVRGKEKLAIATSALSSILEVLLKATPERGPTRRQWVQPLVQLVLVTWRARGLSLSPSMILGTLARLFDFNTEIFDVENDKVFSSQMPYAADEEEDGVTRMTPPPWHDPTVWAGDGGDARSSQTQPSLFSFASPDASYPSTALPGAVGDAPSPVGQVREKQEQQRSIPLSELAIQWVFEVAATLRFSDGITPEEQTQMRRMCCKVCWIYHSFQTPGVLNERRTENDPRKRSSILVRIIRLILTDPARNYALLEILAVLLSQEDSTEQRIMLIKQTQLSRAIFDCITAEINRISAEETTDPVEKQQRWRQREAMMGQLFCFCSACCTNAMGEKGVRVCAYYRGNPFNFCWMGHLCPHPHPSEVITTSKKPNIAWVLAETQRVAELLAEFGYGDALETQKAMNDETSDRSNSRAPVSINADTTKREADDDEEECAGEHSAVAGSGSGSGDAGSGGVAVGADVKLCISSVIGGTSLLEKNLLSACTVLVLDYLSGDDKENAGTTRRRDDEGQPDADDVPGEDNGSHRLEWKGIRGLHVLETPVVYIAVTLLAKLLEMGDPSLVSHLYHLNDTTKKGFLLRAISRLLRNDVSGNGARMRVLRTLIDQTEHTEWVVYSAMVSAVQNYMRVGSTYTLREKDVQNLCALSAQRGQHFRNISDVHRQATPLSDFVIAVRPVIEKHPKAFCAVFNTSCVVHILNPGENSSALYNTETAVWLAPRKPPRVNALNGPRAPHRSAMEQVMDLLLQRLVHKSLLPAVVSTVLNDITTLPAVASMVTTYHVNVPLPESMRTVFAECRGDGDVEHEQRQQEQIADHSFLPANQPPLTPFLAVVLFMRPQLELLEPFLSNVAQKAPSRLVHVLLQALEVLLAALPPYRNNGNNNNNNIQAEEDRAAGDVIEELSPASMVCSLLHVLRLLLAAPSRSLVWRLCDELWQRGALDVLYRILQHKCCTTERDAAALLLVIRRVLLAYGKCNDSGREVARSNHEAYYRTNSGNDTVDGSMMPQQQQHEQEQQEEQQEQQQEITPGGETHLMSESNIAGVSLAQQQQQQQQSPSRAVDDNFYFNDLIIGHDQGNRRRDEDGSPVRTRREESLTDVMLGIGELLHPSEAVMLYRSHQDLGNARDRNRDGDEVVGNELDVIAETDILSNTQTTPISLPADVQGDLVLDIHDDDDDDADDDDDNDDDMDGDGDENPEEEDEDEDEEEVDEELSYVIDQPHSLRGLQQEELRLLPTGLIDESGHDVVAFSMPRVHSEWDYEHYARALDQLPVNDSDDWTLLAGSGGGAGAAGVGHATILEILGRPHTDSAVRNYSFSGGERHYTVSSLVNIYESINTSVERQCGELAVLEPMPRVLRVSEVVPPTTPTNGNSNTNNENNDTNDWGGNHPDTARRIMSLAPFTTGTPTDGVPQRAGESLGHDVALLAALNTTSGGATTAGSGENSIDDANARIHALFSGTTTNSADAGAGFPSSGIQERGSEQQQHVSAAPVAAAGVDAPSIQDGTSGGEEGVPPRSEEVEELPMEQQPWFGAIEPHFLIELPESLRRELLFDNMNLLLCERDRVVEGNRTRIYSAFLTQLPPDVQQEAVEVEQRWRRVAGNELGDNAHGTNVSNVLVEILETVDPVVRRDILLTCDLRDIEESSTLFAEATALRELHSMEAQLDEERAQQHHQEEAMVQQDVGAEEEEEGEDGEDDEEEDGGDGMRDDGAATAAAVAAVELFNVAVQSPVEPRNLLWSIHQQLRDRHSGLPRRVVLGGGGGGVAVGVNNIIGNTSNTVGSRRPGRPSRSHNRITETLLTSRIRAQQNRFTQQDRIPDPPGRQKRRTGSHGAVPSVPSSVLRQLVDLIRLTKGGHTPMEPPTGSSSSLTITSQLVLLLVTACVNTASAVEALLYLLSVALEEPPCAGIANTTSGANSGWSYGRIALQVVLAVDKLTERCRATGLSFTTLPDGVEEGGPLKPLEEACNMAEKQALDAGLFRRLVELVLRYPSPQMEATYAHIMLRLNEQLQALGDSSFEQRRPQEVDHTPISDTVIMHPRHPHRLHWQNLYRYPYTNGCFICNRCNTSYFNDVFAFHCEPCRYDLCPPCSLVQLTAEEEVQRSRRWGYALVESNGTLQAALQLLRHPSCTKEMAVQTARFLSRGIKESARRDTGVGNYDSPISVVERVIIELAVELTAEIHTRVKTFRSAFPGKMMSSSAMLTPELAFSSLFAASSEHKTAVNSNNNNNLVTAGGNGEAVSRPWTAQGASAALFHMNLTCTSNYLHMLFLPYAESHRPEPREVSLMWHASQMYLAEVASILQALPNRSSVLLPQAVLLLLNEFCQFHMAESRKAAWSASVATDSHSSSSFTMEKTETERFMLDTTHTPSTVSDAAASAVPNTRQQQQYATDVSGGAGGSSEPTRDERPSMPRIVRQFVERNKVTINALIQYDPKLLEENFAFLKMEPGFIDFNIRLLDFQRHISYATQGSRISLSISRDQCLRDSFAQLSKLKSFHGSLNVRFRGEEGADAGGLTREWFQLLAEEMVNDNYALFIHSREGMTYQPNPFSDVNSNHLQYFKFAGTVVGMAVAHGVPIDVHFTRAVYRHMTGVQPIFHDLESVDLELYENLNWLLKNDVTDLGLFFTVNCERFGVIQETELLPNGGHIAVTNANKSQYVRLRCEFHMTRQIEQQMEEFLKGFYTVIPRNEIRNFTAQELELVICGMPDIDVEDLRMHTVYEGYTSTSPQIRWFWEVVASMTKEDRANFLQFATGASKVPHGGFSNLESASGSQQRLTITKWEDSADLLPQAHTCFNKIVLPEYSSCEELRKKLMLAITFGSRGFSML